MLVMPAAGPNSYLALHTFYDASRNVCAVSESGCCPASNGNPHLANSFQALGLLSGETHVMKTKGNFWTGFGVGASVGAFAALLPQVIGPNASSRIIRLEKSVQIGRRVDEVFNAWRDFDRLPRFSDNIASIRHFGSHSHWRVNVGGKIIEWDARTEQFIPNQAIAWKSLNGPKHTGRITFSPLGDDTMVHVTMNYVPPVRVLRPVMASLSGHMEGLIEKVLRDFKGSVESRPAGAQGHGSVRTGSAQTGPGTSMTDLPRTGTFGSDERRSELGFGGSVPPVEYTSPPEAKR